MKTKVSLTVLLVAAFLLGACGSPATPTLPPASPTAVPPTDVPPTETLVPSLTPIPATATPVPPPTQTPLPEGVLFRDDFSGSLQPGWTWVNEDASRWSLTDDDWLQIVADDASLLAGGQQSNLLFRDLPDGNFEIIVHLKADPSANFQQAAIFLYEDATHYIAINHGYCAPCVPGGKGVYMDYKIGSDVGAYKQEFKDSDLYLKLSVEGETISAYYGLTPDSWTRLGRFGNIFKFTRVGLGAANIDVEGHGQELTAMYDYFEIRSLP